MQRELARTILRRSSAGHPHVQAALKVSGFVGSLLQAPMHRALSQPVPEQPTMAEYLNGGRRPTLVF